MDENELKETEVIETSVEEATPTEVETDAQPIEVPTEPTVETPTEPVTE